MKLNKTQIAVVSGALLLIVLLLLAKTNLIPKEEAVVSDHANPNTLAFTKMVKAAVDGLNPDQKKAIQKLEEAIKTSPDKKVAFENMINMWDSLRSPSVAAYYMEQTALASPIERNWLEAGNRYYAATRFVKEEADRPLLFGRAMDCFEHVLELNPKNVEAKISLASCYVEGSSEPMKGIGMLKEIEKTDSNNVNLQLNFAFFSEKSGQWAKAIPRFEKVLKIQPDFIEAYLHLADAYQQLGNTEKAIESLKKYITLVDDVTIKAEVQEYINKLTMEATPGQKQ